MEGCEEGLCEEYHVDGALGEVSLQELMVTNLGVSLEVNYFPGSIEPTVGHHVGSNQRPDRPHLAP